MTNATTPSTASHAPAVSIDTQQFRELLSAYISGERGAFAALCSHVEAQMVKDHNRGYAAGYAAMESRATAAEAKLEAIRQGAEGLQEYSPAFKVIGGMAKSNDGGWLCKEELLALLQPQRQADESGLPG